MDYSTSILASHDSSPLVDAVVWLQGLLLGTVATTVAIIAIAGIGFMLLTGRIGWRRGVVTVVGCFILFGAPRIAEGIQSGVVAASDSSTDPEIDYVPPITQTAAPVVATPQPTSHEEPVL